MPILECYSSNSMFVPTLFFHLTLIHASTRTTLGSIWANHTPAIELNTSQLCDNSLRRCCFWF